MPLTNALCPYDPRWVQQFKDEEHLIRTLLQDHIAEVHHVGSTAVAGLLAKPEIDILLIAADSRSIPTARQRLTTLGEATLRRLNEDA